MVKGFSIQFTSLYPSRVPLDSIFIKYPVYTFCIIIQSKIPIIQSEAYNFTRIMKSIMQNEFFSKKISWTYFFIQNHHRLWNIPSIYMYVYICFLIFYIFEYYIDIMCVCVYTCAYTIYMYMCVYVCVQYLYFTLIIIPSQL